MARLSGLAGLGALAGAVLALIYHYQPIGHPEGGYFNLFGLIPASWLEKSPRLKEIVEGYLLPAVLLASFFAGLEELPWFRKGVLDRLFPDPPSFVRSDLDAARRATMTKLEGPVLPFVGREDALEELDVFSTERGPDFRWRTLIGPTGIGKTRLAIEWLEAQRAKGWDVGIVDLDDHARIEGWKARRSTALLIDEPTKNWGGRLGDALFHLSSGSGPGKEVHVLVADQIAPHIACAEGGRRDTVMEGQAARPLRLLGLDDAGLELLRSAALETSLPNGKVAPPLLDVATLRHESGGRPRAALLLLRSKAYNPTYAAALSQWADQFLPMLADNSRPIDLDLIIPLALAALAGPLPTNVATDLCGNVDTTVLTRYFESANVGRLAEVLPALEPDDLAQEILLRALSRLDASNRKALADASLIANPSAVELRLASMWMDHAEAATEKDSFRVQMLAWLQAQFDEAVPERIAALVDDAQNCIAVVSATSLTIDDLGETLAKLEDLVARRPFDARFRLAEAEGAYNAMPTYGEAGLWGDLESWGERLITIAQDPRFASNPEIRLAEASGAVNAMLRYGVAQRWEDLERWGARLVALSEGSRFAKDPNIRRMEANGAVNAVLYYGMAERWDDLERWGARLVAITQDTSLAKYFEIRLAAAMGAYNAIPAYGKHGRWNDFEHWGARLIALAEDTRFRNKPQIRFWEAKGAADAIGYYGTVSRWNDLERWGTRLAAVAEHPHFALNAEIRIEEARGAANAINDYGSAGRWNDLERWGMRLVALAKEPLFAANATVGLYEALGAFNAMFHYGVAKRWDDLERWGAYLVALAANPYLAENCEIRRREAESANNAVVHYGTAERWSDLERWGARLIALAENPCFAGNHEIRLHEARGAFNATVRYSRAGNIGLKTSERWRRRLARVALRFPASIDIQQLANELGLSFVSQAAAGFPYGPP